MAKLTKADDARRLTNDQMEKRLGELAKEQMNIRFRKATNQLENTGLNRQAKREVAQIKTILNERRRLDAAKGV
ncbi:MAG TPA: 50S ribosomal protein L29 [Alphaproteobacteria bacterium]